GGRLARQVAGTGAGCASERRRGEQRRMGDDAKSALDGGRCRGARCRLRHPGLCAKPGGILRVYHWDSPASMSIHEEATYSTVVPMMGVFNNLVMYKQDEPKNSLQSIVPDLATRWSWSEDGMHLTFVLRACVKWHDGRLLT